jgi:hypothetical protein
MHGYFEDQHYQYKVNFSYTKQYSNPYGPMEFSYGGDSLQFQHRNPPALSVQDFPIHSERTLVHKQLQNA